MKWIKIKDQLPEVGKDILISDGHKVRSSVLVYTRNGRRYWFDCEDCLDIRIDDIAFWAELPKGPYAEYIEPRKTFEEELKNLKCEPKIRIF